MIDVEMNTPPDNLRTVQRPRLSVVGLVLLVVLSIILGLP